MTKPAKTSGKAEAVLNADQPHDVGVLLEGDAGDDLQALEGDEAGGLLMLEGDAVEVSNHGE